VIPAGCGAKKSHNFTTEKKGKKSSIFVGNVMLLLWMFLQIQRCSANPMQLQLRFDVLDESMLLLISSFVRPRNDTRLTSSSGDCREEKHRYEKREISYNMEYFHTTVVLVVYNAMFYNLLTFV
jgi:hypothetical protein